MKRLLFFSLLTLLAYQQFTMLAGCANVIPPQGGPRDSLPPRLLRSTPPDSARNFTGNRVSFVFDEFVEVQGIQENLVVSPIPRVSPVVEYRLNTITLRLKEPLEPNTTYTFNFGRAIRDINESNPLQGFTYTFSTGPFLDFLQLRGRVVLAETGKTDTTMIVMLHTSSEDSAVVREKPRYVTRLNSNGEFVFRNLPSRTFYLYALKDEGGSMRYFNERQLFAFADQPVVPGSDTVPIVLYAYATQTTTASARPVRKTADNIADRRLRYQTSLVENRQDLLRPFSISFDQPLKLFDSTGIILSRDSTFEPVSGYSFRPDSSRKTIVLDYQLEQNTRYNVVLRQNFAEDSAGRKLLKQDTIRFHTRKLADYGSLKLRIRNLDLAQKPVLLVLRNDNVVASYPLKSNEITEPVFLPGEYELRVLYDRNGNGRWDPGVFFGERRQPEIVKPIERRITIKPNAPNEFEISL